MLELSGGLLQSDGLQFGYKKGISTTQCTWLVQEVMQNYLSNSSHPFVAVFDNSRAFDLARWDKLLERLQTPCNRCACPPLQLQESARLGFVGDFLNPR